jgi:hypothetical protein
MTNSGFLRCTGLGTTLADGFSEYNATSVGSAPQLNPLPQAEPFPEGPPIRAPQMRRRSLLIGRLAPYMQKCAAAIGCWRRKGTGT